MARRKKEFSKNNGNTRKKDTRETTKKVIIACEDEKVSPTYFKLIIKKLITDKKITQNSLVIASHNHTNPTGVLNDLTNTKDWESFDKGYKWIVIDRDVSQTNKGTGHRAEDFNNAISQADSKNINVAYSNDSFELWYLLHFDYVCNEMGRNDINSKLISKLKKIDQKQFSKLSEKSLKTKETTKNIFAKLLPLQGMAIQNAKKLLLSYKLPSCPGKNNPSTSVHKLVELLNNLKD